MSSVAGGTGVWRHLMRWRGTQVSRLHRMARALEAVPQTLRALVRADELWLMVLAAVIGVVAGLLVVGMQEVAEFLHHVLFNLTPNERLSATDSVDPYRALLVPTLGGLAVGGLVWACGRWWGSKTIDPIEANALYGGQMSFADSLILVVQTLLSNGVGASVGLEAGYTQIGSAVGSRAGRAFRVRRSDLRVLVGCGAAGAVAAAFNAPLTGAFYAFELVIGTYSLAILGPVVVSAICAVMVMRPLTPELIGFNIHTTASINTVDYPPILALSMLCALGGIALMRGVTLTESIFRRSRVPAWLRPALGGGVVGGLALITPQVLSSGHSALHKGLDAPYPLTYILLILVIKAIGSAVSIGSGFRGGLFFASLFLGALLGKLFAGLLALMLAVPAPPMIVCAVVGMSAMAVAVVGGPLTMTFMALESTGSLPMTAVVLGAAVVSAVTVRRTFGYSFATWRFHLRGEAIRSAVDVGWMRSLTVGRMMRREFRTIPATTPLAAFRREFALGAMERVVAVDERDRYVGIVTVAEAHAQAMPDTALRVSDVMHHPKTVLLPQMTIKEAVAVFADSESDALAVVDGAESMRVIGVLTEKYALRRYSEELDRRRRELSGE